MNDHIAQALSKLFDRRRIVFWYDAERTWRDDFEALSLPGIEKVEIAGNEYGLKHRLLREQPEQKFLLYHEGPQPPDLENWLLDVQLAHDTFSANQAAIYLSELGLPPEFVDVVTQHMEFCRSEKRKEALRQLLKEDDNATQIRIKMLAVCADSEPRLDSILEKLLQELAKRREEKSKRISRCNLTDFLWERMASVYGYQSSEPGVRDFAIELFKSCYAMGTGGEATLNSDALVFLNRFSRAFKDNFKDLSEECAKVLGIEQDLAKRDFRDLVKLDYFRLIDQKIISDLVGEIVARTVSSSDVSAWVGKRRTGCWHNTYEDVYEAIDYAARFIHTLRETRLEMTSLAEGVNNYCRTWCELDFLYRKFTYHGRKSGQASLLHNLTEQIENRYSNTYLLKLNNRFQAFVDDASGWDALPLPKQREFFERWVQPFLDKGNKVCVIVSDALRYEIGHELMGLIRQNDRYDAELEAALAMLPSYTQLGMAALLPNKELAIADNKTASVLVDGQSAQGTANRIKILQAALAGRGTAIQADDLMRQHTHDETRPLLKANDVVYVYHNRIDHAGDKIQSEGRAFEAAQEALVDLVELVKKLTAANANNIIVTADHGFIYQNQALDESDFLGVEAAGNVILHKNRRFVLGKGLAASKRLRTFSPRQLGLVGNVEVQIPKSINRLRLKGSGSRFVHGGASLQEVVIPVLKINKKRQSDVSKVEVNIVGPDANSVITSGQLAVRLYQTKPVTDKVQPRNLRAGIYTEAGNLISDCHDLNFDRKADNSREREVQIRFVLTRKADEANQQEVILRLKEKYEGTSHYEEYKSRRYTMRRSFTSDFDF